MDYSILIIYLNRILKIINNKCYGNNDINLTYLFLVFVFVLFCVFFNKLLKRSNSKDVDILNNK